MELGTEFEIRQATPADSEAVRAFLEHLSEDARWLRFHSPYPVIKSWMVRAMTDIDHSTHEALLAWHEGQVVGVAEWGRNQEEDDVADCAVVVDDDYRRRGVARALMACLTENAREHGIDMFTASVLSVNRPTIALIQNTTRERQISFDGPVLNVAIPLAPTA